MQHHIRGDILFCEIQIQAHVFLSSNPAVTAIMETGLPVGRPERSVRMASEDGEEEEGWNDVQANAAFVDAEEPLASSGLTSSASLYCNAVHRLHERNFVKAVYTALRYAALLQAPDQSTNCQRKGIMR